eukprot:gene45094-32462_t
MAVRPHSAPAGGRYAREWSALPPAHQKGDRARAAPRGLRPMMTRDSHRPSRQRWAGKRPRRRWGDVIVGAAGPMVAPPPVDAVTGHPHCRVDNTAPCT